jgi:hypothetical protein
MICKAITFVFMFPGERNWQRDWPTAPLQTLPSQVDASIDPTEGASARGRQHQQHSLLRMHAVCRSILWLLLSVLLVVTIGTIHVLTGIESRSGFLCKTEAVYENGQWWRWKQSLRNRIIIVFSLFRYISANCVANRTVCKRVHVQVSTSATLWTVLPTPVH